MAGDLPIRHPTAYRPLRSILYAISYLIWGENYWGYHLQSVLVHMTGMVFLYLILKVVVKNTHLSGLGASVFGLHPVQTEAVTWISSSFDTIGSVFFLSSVWIYLESDRKKRWSWLAIVLGLCAMYIYELALILPIIFLMVEFLIFRSKITVNFVWKKYGLLFLGMVPYFLMKLEVMQSLGPQTRVFDEWWKNLWLIGVISFKYIKIIFWPIDQSLVHIIKPGISSYFFHDFFQTKVIADMSFWDREALAGLITIALLVWYGWKFRKKQPIISFAVWWVLIGLLPVLQLIPLQTLFAERYLYLSMVGVCLLLVKIVRTLSSSNRILTFIVTSFLIGGLWIQTYRRNLDWGSPINLWLETERSAPESSLVQHNLGYAYEQKMQLELALRHYEKAVELNPESETNRRKLGKILYKLEEYQRAESVLMDLALEYPEKALYLILLADNYAEWGKNELAEFNYHKALSLEPQNEYVLNRLITKEVYQF